MSKSDVLIVWNRENGFVRLAARCGPCNGMGRLFVNSVESDDCEHCSGRGWFGFDPERPVIADPGSYERIAMLSVRYASGVALWNRQDRPEDEQTVRRISQSLLDRLARNGHDMTAAELNSLSLAP